MRPVGIHTAWWRYPGGYPDANFNFAHLKHFAQTLERAKFDAFFMADHPAVLNMPIEALQRSATVTSFDPLTPAASPRRRDQAPGTGPRSVAIRTT
jgi:alkanesulfonate monooxygenase SsuD/methylene tetrahydromethanopterin reductase-like flavin-dependent oxidoreductase (luciferase family)